MYNNNLLLGINSPNNSPLQASISLYSLCLYKIRYVFLYHDYMNSRSTFGTFCHAGVTLTLKALNIFVKNMETKVFISI